MGESEKGRTKHVLCDRGDKAGFDDEGQVGELSVSEHFPVPVSECVNDGHHLRIGREPLLLLGGHERPELVDVDDRTPVHVPGQVEMPHADLSKVPVREGSFGLGEYFRSTRSTTHPGWYLSKLIRWWC